MMQHLRELIDMGFAPMMALVIAAVVVLWLALCGLVLFVWRQFQKDRRERDELRQAQISDLDKRLKYSASKHEECDKDREKIHTELGKLDRRIARYESCHKKDCPFRVIPQPN